MEELNTALTELETYLKALEETKGAYDESIAKQKMQDVELYFELVRLDMSDLPKEQRDERRDTLRRIARRVRECRSLMNWCSTTSQPNHSSEFDEILQHGRNLQAESLASLQRMVSTVADTAVIGREVATKIAQQTEQVKAQAAALDELAEEQQRADRVVRRMVRRVANDRAVQVLTGAVAASAAVAVGLKFG